MNVKTVDQAIIELKELLDISDETQWREKGFVIGRKFSVHKNHRSREEVLEILVSWLHENRIDDHQILVDEITVLVTPYRDWEPDRKSVV